MKKSKNLALWVAIAIPLGMILLVFASVQLPRMWLNPQYDFVYLLPESYFDNWNRLYRVQNGTVERTNAWNKIDWDRYDKDLKDNPGQFYRYSPTTDRLEELAFEQVEQLRLDAGPTSPDGYTVSNERKRRGDIFSEILFSSSYERAFYVHKGRHTRRLTTLNHDRYRYYDAHFIGWILP